MKSQDSHQNPSGTHISSIQRPTAKYNRLSNTMRQITPGPWQCAMFCGGKNCKNDNPARWSDNMMALRGLYSSWVGDNILAIARPSSEAIEKYHIIEQFQQHGIKSIINLQRPGEHSSCGNPLQTSGFSYQPEQFMDNDIFFYNFGWDDYGIRSLPSILDMVKVMSFALTQGKVAVHCHAGLGRTGVLIACFLIYEQRMEGDNAIQFVRSKRLGSIQTPGQIECCQQFAKFLIPFRVVFSSCDPCAYPFTLDQFLIRQKLMLHGYEARELKYLPKIVKVACNQLAQLAHCAINIQQPPPKENIDILKKTAPGAFLSQRQLENTPLSPHEKRLSDYGSSNRLPPLRARSSSAENLAIPQTSSGIIGDRSPMLNMRRNLTQASSSSSDDDHSAIVDPSETMIPQRNATFVKRRGNSASNFQPAELRRDSILSAGVNRSVSMLAALLIDNVQDVDDVQLVGTSMAFDASSPNANPDELSPVLQKLQGRVNSMQQNLNRSTSAWEIVSTEEDPFVLSMLMWSWLEHLEKPILSKAHMMRLEAEFDEDDPAVAFKILDRGVKQTLDYILRTVSKLSLQPHLEHLEDSILVRVIKAVTHISAVHLLNVECSTHEREDENDDALLSHLLMMFRIYVMYWKSSGTDDNIALSSQTSSLLSYNNTALSKSNAKGVSKVSPSERIEISRKKATEKVKCKKSSDNTAEDVTSTVGGSNSQFSTGMNSFPDANESFSQDSQSQSRDGLSRQKLKPLAKTTENTDALASSIPRKNALPPIF